MRVGKLVTTKIISSSHFPLHRAHSLLSQTGQFAFPQTWMSIFLSCSTSSKYIYSEVCYSTIQGKLSGCSINSCSMKLVSLFTTFFFFYGRFLLCIPGWTRTHCVEQSGIEILVSCLSPPKSWDYRHAPLTQISPVTLLFLKQQTRSKEMGQPLDMHAACQVSKKPGEYSVPGLLPTLLTRLPTPNSPDQRWASLLQLCFAI